MESNSLWHIDAFGRVVEIDKKYQAEEMYLSPVDGRLKPLFVQGMKHDPHEPGGTEATGRWQRCGPPVMRVSLILRLVHWTYSSMVVLKWIPSCLLLLPMLFWPQNLEGTWRNNGNYDQVCAFDRQYPRVARNHKENRDRNDGDATRERENGEESLQPLLSDGHIEMTSISRASGASAINDNSSIKEIQDDYDDLLPRHLGPRFLCFLQYDPNGNLTGCETRLVADWVREHGDDSDTDFVFLSYTRKQFCVATSEELTNWDVDSTTRETLFGIAPQDREMLREYGIKAALAAGKHAFWLDFECIRDADGLSKATSQSFDVYRICDIVRAAHSLAILVGPPLQSRYSPATEQLYSPEALAQWLSEWGTRLWTLPEILLISSEKRVKIFVVDGPSTPLEWAKRHFASRSIWRDAKLVRQLIDHYESSIHLKPLELISIALDCFTRRSTEQFNQADIVYALMGLLRRRPAVNKSDTSFIAFARLSLVNDTESLLERLICLQPTHPGLPWYDQGDFWSSKLWDVEPTCQVAGIVDDGTVTLDSAYGATIQWDSMEQVHFIKRSTFMRALAKVVLRGVPVYLVFGLVMTITGAAIKQNGSPTLPLLIPGIIILIPSVIILIFAPAMLLNIYDGKFWSTQALFIGMEGVPSELGYVEKRLFGSARGRLKWSVAGSQLSRHELSPKGECVGLPPLLDNNDHLPVFTLFDTFSMTAVAFRSARPPTSVVVFGREGGMQRAALCSYDWKRNIFAREQIIRLKTTVLDRMPRMERFRFSLERQPAPDSAQGTSSYYRPREPVAKLNVDSYTGGAFGKWTTDVALLPYMFVMIDEFAVDGFGLMSLVYFFGFLVAQLFVPFCFRHISMRYVTGGVGILEYVIFLSWDLVPISGVIVSYKTQNALYLLFGVAQGLLSSSFVFLTREWYGPTSAGAFRLLIWTCGLPLFTGIWKQFIDLGLSLSDGYFSYALTLHVVRLLLSVYACFFVGTPDQVHWSNLRDRARYVTMQSMVHDDSGPTKKVSLPPWTFADIISLTTASREATDKTFETIETAAHMALLLSFFSVGWRCLSFVTVALFPIALLLLVGIAFRTAPKLRVPVILLFLCITFALAISSDNNLAISKPSHYLFVMFPTMTQLLVWAFLITETQEPAWRVETLAVTMGGYAAGRVVLIAVKGWRMVRCDFIDWPNCRSELSDWSWETQISYLSVMFALDVAVILAWGIYKWKSDRHRRRGRELILRENSSILPLAMLLPRLMAGHALFRPVTGTKLRPLIGPAGRMIRCFQHDTGPKLFHGRTPLRSHRTNDGLIFPSPIHSIGRDDVHDEGVIDHDIEKAKSALIGNDIRKWLLQDDTLEEGLYSLPYDAISTAVKKAISTHLLPDASEVDNIKLETLCCGPFSDGVMHVVGGDDYEYEPDELSIMTFRFPDPMQGGCDMLLYLGLWQNPHSSGDDDVTPLEEDLEHDKSLHSIADLQYRELLRYGNYDWNRMEDDGGRDNDERRDEKARRVTITASPARFTTRYTPGLLPHGPAGDYVLRGWPGDYPAAVAREKAANPGQTAKRSREKRDRTTGADRHIPLLPIHW
ncbi:hypothetical protein PG985_009696 [Apiospora marii]|uniref:uncharacterized protein n=1 Tax=Apiospora marii TaxID=335849 RepID=UPI0031303071